MTQLLHDLFLGMGTRDGQLFDQQIARRVEHLSFTEGKLLVAFQHKQIPQDFGATSSAMSPVLQISKTLSQPIPSGD